MADKIRYPQIPTTVWWGVRDFLKKTPNVTIDERFLGVSLGVQEAAARQYVVELKAVGILTEEGKATPVALKWRLDDQYLEAVDELIAANYPEGLRSLAPAGEAERSKVVSWFLREGLGQGAAGNKAATYLLIGSRAPNETPGRAATARAPKEEAPKGSSTTRPSPAKASTVAPKQRSKEVSVPLADQDTGHRQRTDPIPLNINVQIHISADAGPEQIEAIFSAMRRYLHDDQNT